MKLSIAQLEENLQDLHNKLANLDKTNYKSAKVYRRKIREIRQDLKKQLKGSEQ